MTAMSLTVQAARLKVDFVRYHARRATLRLMWRVLDWLEPTW
jgi:hypothetical protein